MLIQNIAIHISQISKKYIVHHEKPTLMEKIIKGQDEEFYALRNINLQIKNGERVGLIGPNGSGKTTLLKIIAGITTPTSGTIKTSGRVVSLIDLAAGFHPDLTGVENILLNGLLIGMTKNEIKKRLNEIIEYAGIGKFIDAQLFTYSEGMKLRLGFSIAVHANPDILILDENIAVGDMDFGKKSFRTINKLVKQGKTVVISSHDVNLLKKICTSVVWLENGIIRLKGKAGFVISKYKQLNI
jgi:lipopolysaccharide transport system ATP-binding protein